jgi:hypothetical protein
MAADLGDLKIAVLEFGITQPEAELESGPNILLQWLCESYSPSTRGLLVVKLRTASNRR